MLPLVPTTWAVYEPIALAVTVSVAVPEFVMVDGLRDAVSPEEEVSVKDTTPVNPLMDVIVMVEAAVEPGGVLSIVGLALIVKSAVEDATVIPMATV